LTSAQLYTVVRVAGAAYLVFIGGKTLLGVLRAARTTPQPAATAPVESVAAGRAEASAVSRSSGARSSVEPGASEPATPARFGQSEPEKSAQSAGAAFLLGVVSNLLNVKVVVFYVTFLPQFVTPGPGATTRTAMLAMTFIGLAVAWWICYILLLDKIGRWMRRPRVERVIEGLTGAVLVGLGIKVALDM
ncbi:MAG: LysE family translocator, partial [Micromonosporaceae bacterium]